MKRLAIAAVGLALVVGVVTGCRSSGYSQAEVEGTVSAVQTASAEQPPQTPTLTTTSVPTAEGGGSGGLRRPTPKSISIPRLRTAIAGPPSPPPRYTPEEAVGFVRAALYQESICETTAYPAKRWAAVFDGNRGAWEVAVGCWESAGSPLSYIPDTWSNFRWRFFEEGDRVIPLTDDATNAMQPFN